jgi:nicotinate-nucleotide adenylyltransferase
MTAETPRQRIALFGGSFDPPQIAHKNIPIYLLQHGYADQVWYVPVKHHPFGKVVSSDDCRVEMLELVIAQLQREEPQFADAIRVEPWEVQQDEMSYTYRTLQELSRQHPDAEFRWVIGSDNVEKFAQWQNYQEILSTYGVVVYPRAGYPLKKTVAGNGAVERSAGTGSVFNTRP